MFVVAASEWWFYFLLHCFLHPPNCLYQAQVCVDKQISCFSWLSGVTQLRSLTWVLLAPAVGKKGRFCTGHIWAAQTPFEPSPLVLPRAQERPQLQKLCPKGPGGRHHVLRCGPRRMQAGEGNLRIVLTALLPSAHMVLSVARQGKGVAAGCL